VAAGVEGRLAQRVAAVVVTRVVGARWEVRVMVGAAAWCLRVMKMAHREHETNELTDNNHTHTSSSAVLHGCCVPCVVYMYASR
jgi:hypothetical protein